MRRPAAQSDGPKGESQHGRPRTLIELVDRAVALGRLALIAAAGGYSVWVASTDPFTGSADLAVGVGLGLGAAIAAIALWQRVKGRTAPADSLRSRLLSGSLTKPSFEIGNARVEPGSVVAWALVLALFVLLEVVTYAAGISDRHAFPTLSSLYDQAATSRPDKTVIVFLWSVLGWGLFRR